ncbi:olfactory receptor 1J4-like [Diceros bicornis minor]|uniref:olfactory receptor 1J4-like n=1 Tax=Diceros bicornis minor TaxID=77932 RepID=UPI0026EABA57|nr:olfactory receptor 1J4-like [Diceros bicornis minor]
MYLTVVLENLLIILLIRLDSRLHIPMYFFLSHLAFSDVFLPSVTIPKMLMDMHAKYKSIPYAACFSQMPKKKGVQGIMGISDTISCDSSPSSFWKHSLPKSLVKEYESAEAPHISSICLDIGSPEKKGPLIHAYDLLKYMHHSSVDESSTLGVRLLSLLLEKQKNLLLTNEQRSKRAQTSAQQCTNLCSYAETIILHFACDLTALLKRSCSDISLNELVVVTKGGMLFILPLSSVLGPCILIVTTILRVPSTKRFFKAFSTCGSHLFVVFLYYGTIAGVSFFSSSSISNNKDIIASVMYMVVAPIVYPFIYGLKNRYEI